MPTTGRARTGDEVTPRDPGVEHTVDPTGDPMTGRVLDGRYLVGDRIARGGMASVYRATDLRLDRMVAVKVMHHWLVDDGDFAARFVREARSAARLSHPHVVAVHDQGEDDGVVFLVMELVPGHTLRDTITAQAPLPAGRALALLEPVLAALAVAHRSGIIHRDVKPENVLIAGDGRVKVADFGLAKAVTTGSQHHQHSNTATGGVLIGTVSYLAPEIVVSGHADARADVYAAGILLYELLTGTKPHIGESPIQVAYRHVHHDVPPPSRTVPGIPPYVDALVARATARDPSLRPTDAGVLLQQARRVSHALSHGVTDDPELTEDLAPHLRSPEPELPHVNASPSHTAPIAWPPVPAGPPHQPPLPRTPPAPSRTPRRSPAQPVARRRGRLLVVLALLLALAAGGGAYWLGWARYTATPGVLGLTEAAAERELEAAGLRVEYADPAYSETVAEGRVLETDPAAGDRVLDGGTVTVTLSLGKERYDVPRLQGLTEGQARDRLEEQHLTYDETVERWSETVPDGVVIASLPMAGTTLRPDAPVDLVVSKGRRPIHVGDWVGRDLDTVTAALQRRGLEPEVVAEEFSDTVPAGHVVAQQPRPGAALFRGQAVSLTVSRGPELVEVPSVTAYGVEAAEAKLRAAGFDVEQRNDDDYIGLGFVVRTDPPAGELARRGSTVTLFVI